MRDVGWKGFKVGELFTYERGKESSPKRVKDGDIPMVAEINTNNGVAKFGSSPNIINGNSISISVNFAENVYYQENDFIASVNVIVIRNKHLNRWNGRFIETVLRANNKKYNYVNKISKQKLRDEIITLPATSSGEPDYDYMEEYIKEKQEVVSKRLDMLTKTRESRKTVLYGISDSENSGLTLKEFKLGDLFNVRAGGRVTRKAQKEGNIPYVTAVSFNNGIENYISNPVFTEHNIITVNFLGNVFYHPYEVSYKDGTYGLTPKKDLTGNQMLYLVSIIQKKTLEKGSYTNAIRIIDLQNLGMVLPATSSGEPDYDYMEEYIRVQQGLVKERLDALGSMIK